MIPRCAALALVVFLASNLVAGVRAAETPPVPGTPAAASDIEDWMKDKDVVNVCVVGPYLAADEFKSEFLASVADGDRDIHITITSEGETRSTITLTLYCTPENLHRLQALERRGYSIDHKRSAALSFKGDDARRRDARVLAAHVAAALDMNLKKKIRGLTSEVRSIRSEDVAGVAYHLEDAVHGSYIRIQEITPDRDKGNAAPEDVELSLPHLGLIVTSLNRIGHDEEVQDILQQELAPLIKLEAEATPPRRPPSTAPAAAPAATAPAAHLSPAEQGIAQAKADIAADKLHIHYFGKPWSADKPLIDDASGLPVEIVEGCVVSDEFVQQTDAYNKTMREAAATRAAPKR